MQLHNGTPFWHTTKSNASYLTMQHDEQTEVLIIGGGMTGALISYMLMRENIPTIVIDKNIPGYGSSDGNTGIIQYNSDKSLNTMINDFSEQRAVDFYKLSLDAMKNLDKISTEIDPDTGYKRKNSLFLCASNNDKYDLEKNYATLKKYNFPAEFISKECLFKNFGLKAECAILTSHDAELNPFKFIQAIHRKNLENGVKIFANTELLYVKNDGNIIEASLSNGKKIKTKHLIYATGYYKNIIPEVEPFVERNSTYSFVSKPINKFWGNKELIWDSHDPYLYFRSTEDNRIIAGGQDEKGMILANENKINKENLKVLSQIKKYFTTDEIVPEYLWTSVFAESKDGLPFIDKRNTNNEYFALGFGGNGTCYASIASLIIKSYILGNPHPLAYTVSLNGRF